MYCEVFSKEDLPALLLFIFFLQQLQLCYWSWNVFWWNIRNYGNQLKLLWKFWITCIVWFIAEWCATQILPKSCDSWWRSLMTLKERLELGYHDRCHVSRLMVLSLLFCSWKLQKKRVPSMQLHVGLCVGAEGPSSQETWYESAQVRLLWGQVPRGRTNGCTYEQETWGEVGCWGS